MAMFPTNLFQTQICLYDCQGNLNQDDYDNENFEVREPKYYPYKEELPSNPLVDYNLNTLNNENSLFATVQSQYYQEENEIHQIIINSQGIHQIIINSSGDFNEDAIEAEFKLIEDYGEQ